MVYVCHRPEWRFAFVIKEPDLLLAQQGLIIIGYRMKAQDDSLVNEDIPEVATSSGS